jgi:restriction endonuclease Mrr
MVVFLANRANLQSKRLHDRIQNRLDGEFIEAAVFPYPHAQVTFRPVVRITVDTNAVFETSVGAIHRSKSLTPERRHAVRRRREQLEISRSHLYQ